MLISLFYNYYWYKKKHSLMDASVDSRVSLTQSESWYHHLLDMRPWGCHLTSLFSTIFHL